MTIYQRKVNSHFFMQSRQVKLSVLCLEKNEMAAEFKKGETRKGKDLIENTKIRNRN